MKIEVAILFWRKKCFVSLKVIWKLIVHCPYPPLPFPGFANTGDNFLPPQESSLPEGVRYHLRQQQWRMKTPWLDTLKTPWNALKHLQNTLAWLLKFHYPANSPPSFIETPGAKLTSFPTICCPQNRQFTILQNLRAIYSYLPFFCFLWSRGKGKIVGQVMIKQRPHIIKALGLQSDRVTKNNPNPIEYPGQRTT